MLKICTIFQRYFATDAKQKVTTKRLEVRIRVEYIKKEK